MANYTVSHSYLNKQKLNKPKQYLCTHITRASESLHSARGELDRAIDSLEKLDALRSARAKVYMGLALGDMKKHIDCIIRNARNAIEKAELAKVMVDKSYSTMRDK